MNKSKFCSPVRRDDVGVLWVRRGSGERLLNQTSQEGSHRGGSIRREHLSSAGWTNCKPSAH